MNPLRDWFRRQFSDPQVVILAMLLFVGFMIIAWLGGMLGPVFAAMVIAYLLEGLVEKCQKIRLPRLVAVLVVFVLFMAFTIYILFALIPLLIQQVAHLVQQLPGWVAQGQKELLRLPERYPDYISAEQVQGIMGALAEQLTEKGQAFVSVSVGVAGRLIALLIYLILVPLMIFFFLKDKESIMGWITSFLPENRGLANRVWHEVDQQIGNYIRGKFWEIIIVWSATYVTFTVLDLEYAMLLAVFVGLSVLIPYIGATVMTIPVALIAFFQWGAGPEFAWVVIAYLIIQLLDGNLLGPLLLSEVTSLHPVAVIAAVLVFGGLWGFWGVFFAIPLATLVNAVLRAWPRKGDLVAEAGPAGGVESE